MNELTRLRRRVHELEARCMKLELEARQDDLTGLLSRRRVGLALSQELSRTERYGASTSLVMIDLDHFKEVNDQNGHAVGDEVLRRVGAAVARMVRATDSAGRFGGEELLLVLADTGEGDAWVLAERVRAAIAELDLNGVRVTASLGVASAHDEAEAKEVLERADQAMYAAKRKGRDRVEVK
jgi:diguanylate cyclase (GGDEF)-like protein